MLSFCKYWTACHYWAFFYFLVLLMHMFLFMFTCMEERPAMSRADFQARRDSSQGNWTSSSHCHVNCCHTVTVHTHSTRHSFSIILDSTPCPSMAQPSHKF